MFQFRSIVFGALLALCCHFAQGQSIITTIAGNGVTQYIGDGYPATSFSLANPKGICMDAHRNILIADYSNMRIRLLKPNDSIFTISGDGTVGYTGDHGLFPNARYNYPAGVCFDQTGNLYIADFENFVVRKVNGATNEITTVCGDGSSGFLGDGAAATLAKMGPPKSIAVDRTGNLYIMDGENHRVRVMRPDGTIETVAGNGTIGYSGDGHAATSASFAYATGVCTDSAGNVYVADRGNNVIRKIDVQTGIISTVAGNGTSGYSGNGGNATDAALSAPTAVFVDKHNNLFICDDGNNVLRGVDNHGIIHLVAGTTGLGYSGDGGPATDATFSNLSGVFVDDSDYVYIIDIGNAAIRKLTPPHLGVQNVAPTFEGRIYPNPVQDFFYVELDADHDDVQWAIIDISGREMLNGAFKSSKTRIELPVLPTGFYVLRLESKDGVIYKKIAVEK